MTKIRASEIIELQRYKLDKQTEEHKQELHEIFEVLQDIANEVSPQYALGAPCLFNVQVLLTHIRNEKERGNLIVKGKR